jgi:hypothetical protein
MDGNWNDVGRCPRPPGHGLAGIDGRVATVARVARVATTCSICTQWSHNSDRILGLLVYPYGISQLLGRLRSLGPQLHQRQNQRIRRHTEKSCDPDIPPAVGCFGDVDREQKVGSRSVWADLAVGSRHRVQQIRTGIDGSEIFLQELLTRLAVRGIKHGQLFLGAYHGRAPDAEPGKCSDEVREGLLGQAKRQRPVSR